MIFVKTKLPGVFVVELEPKVDYRGFLARTFDRDELKNHGVTLDIAQGYTCYTKKKGSLRGFHYIIPPFQETKLIRVVRGSFYEVVLDLRPKSTTHKQWLGQTIQASEYKMLIIPPGCAHAVLTLEDNTEHISFYTPSYDSTIERGIRYDDPTFSISWPIPIASVSEKDKSWPAYI